MKIYQNLAVLAMHSRAGSFCFRHKCVAYCAHMISLICTSGSYTHWSLHEKLVK